MTMIKAITNKMYSVKKIIGDILSTPNLKSNIFLSTKWRNRAQDCTFLIIIITMLMFVKWSRLTYITIQVKAAFSLKF